ncbi:MAG: hypothetical protein H8E71_00515 [Candidatus Marinimicrobia bacterium]|nr:hypothetical protein [Candidatus Neomarinimicrobiota bacterium]
MTKNKKESKEIAIISFFEDLFDEEIQKEIIKYIYLDYDAKNFVEEIIKKNTPKTKND